jgi:hypothetical protein
MSETGDKPAAARTREPRQMLCPGCMAANDPLADYCIKCGMPLGACAGMDPLKSIYLQGRLYRQAASSRPPTIALIGMWLLFGPFVAVGVFATIAFLKGMSSLTDAFVDPAGFPILAVLVLYAAVLYKVTRNYVRSRGLTPGSCKECGYNLFGLPEPRCPECGTAFDMEEVQEELGTVEPARQPGPRPSWSQADLAYALAVGLCYLPGLGAIAMAFLRPESETFLADIFRGMPCVTQVAGILLLLSGIRQAYRRCEDGLSRLFVVAIAANILLALGILWVPLAIL